MDRSLCLNKSRVNFRFLLISILTLFTVTAFSKNVHIQGKFKCGIGYDGDFRLLNCENAYLHGINFGKKSEIHATTKIEIDGKFNLEIRLDDTIAEKNEMTFILRSRDEDRTLGVFYVMDNPQLDIETESFFIDQDQDFGELKVTQKRMVPVLFSKIK